MKQRTAEEWQAWITEFVEEANVDKLLRDDVFGHVTEQVFMNVFIDSLARAGLRKAVADGDITRRGSYEMAELMAYTRVTVMGALLVGFALGQEVQKGT